MSEYLITLIENGRCSIKHLLGDAVITTDLPPEYGENAKAFSSLVHGEAKPFDLFDRCAQEEASKGKN